MDEFVKKLNDVFGEKSSSQVIVYHQWYSEFKRRCTTMTEEERSKRPNTSVTPENVNAVENLIRDNC